MTCVCSVGIYTDTEYGCPGTQRAASGGINPAPSQASCLPVHIQPDLLETLPTCQESFEDFGIDDMTRNRPIRPITRLTCINAPSRRDAKPSQLVTMTLLIG